MTLPGNQSSPNQVHTNASASLDVKSGSPNVSPQASPGLQTKNQHKREASVSSVKELIPDTQEKSEYSSSTPKTSTSELSGGELSRSNSQEPVKERKTSDRVKKKTPWYSALYPTYKSRSDDFKRIFKDIPSEERLVVEYSCAIQRDILVHGRLYVSQNYLCFYANIFRWETQVTIRWKDVTSLTKEKTALVIPNAILVHTTSDRHFLTSFTARDKAFLMLFRVWQNALMDQPMSTQEMWQWVHSCYGDELGLTSDDDDYIAPATTDPLNPQPLDDDKSFGGKGDRNSDSSYSEANNNNSNDGNVFNENEKFPQAVVQPPTPTSPSEHLASDPSDSSPSESESEKHGTLITCPCLHEGRLLVHMQVSIHVDQLFTHLFTNSKFAFDLHETRKSTDVKQSPWVTNPSTNQKGRTVSHTVPIAQAIGPKQTQVTESQENYKFDTMQDTPQSPEDWKILLQKQEQLHTAELERWVRILKASIHLLNEVEQSLSKLQMSLHTVLSPNILKQSSSSPPNSKATETTKKSPPSTKSTDSSKPIDKPVNNSFNHTHSKLGEAAQNLAQPQQKIELIRRFCPVSLCHIGR
nr:GRAM domain-containing protein 1A-like [Halyomorpha halys]